ncbi:MAG: DUF3108 domain-containing protein [Muribaculaceae bacterium]|nr:DUF3108 domain-containing protein [Muribaculaceae bacterium]
MIRSILRIVAILLLSFSVSHEASAAETLISHRLEPETLHYKVMYKWGLINKQAGTATITLSHTTEGYHATVTAASAPWADKLYCVRDTLIGRMTYPGFAPLYYEKIAHEGSEQKHDVVRYTHYDNGLVVAQCSRKEWKKGEQKVDEQQTLETDDTVVDILASFYYMRSLPYDSWKAGHQVGLDIFSGKQKERLTINYKGIEEVTIGEMSRRTYHITFTFTSRGGKKSSDDMDAWIAADDTRIPLRLEGKLPIGSVHCILTGAKN